MMSNRFSLTLRQLCFINNSSSSSSSIVNSVLSGSCINSNANSLKINSIFAAQVRFSGGGKRRPSKAPRLNWKEKLQLGLDKPQIPFKPKPFGYVDEDLQAFRKEGDYIVKLSSSNSLKQPDNNIGKWFYPK